MTTKFFGWRGVLLMQERPCMSVEQGLESEIGKNAAQEGCEENEIASLRNRTSSYENGNVDSVDYENEENNENENGDDEEERVDELEMMGEWVYDELPEVLREAVMSIKRPREREMVLLGSLVACSSMFPMFYGVYGNKMVAPNLYLYVGGPAASGKGEIGVCGRLVEKAHRREFDKYLSAMKDYKVVLAKYEARHGEERGEPMPPAPELRMLRMPANTTTTSLCQHLADNNKGLIIIDTEGDTMLNAFKNEYGDYRSVLLKAFHQEEVSFVRRTNNEFRVCSKPRLSLILTGTMNQLYGMFKQGPDSLFSRFLFYRLPVDMSWHDPFEVREGKSPDELFADAGERLYDLAERLGENDMLYRFLTTESQGGRFNSFFAKMKSEYMNVFGEMIVPSIHRMGLITYKMAMVLTALRGEESGLMNGEVHRKAASSRWVDMRGGSLESAYGRDKVDEETVRYAVCSDKDMEIALALAEMAMRHTVETVLMMPKRRKVRSEAEKQMIKNRYNWFFAHLPNEFTPDDVKELLEQCLKVSRSGWYRQQQKLETDGYIVKNDEGCYVKMVGEFPYKVK